MIHQLVLKRKNKTASKLVPLTNLNDGMGDPCAGHIRESIDPDSLTKVLLLESCENFGLAPPMGSAEKGEMYSPSSSTPDLKEGMGEA